MTSMINAILMESIMATRIMKDMFTEFILDNDVITVVWFLEEKRVVHFRWVHSYRAGIHIVPDFYNKIKSSAKTRKTSNNGHPNILGSIHLWYL